MIVDSFEDAPPPERARALADFERQFTYPLGPGRSFRIEHDSDYARFYRAAGAARCFVASEGECVLGVLAAAIRPLFLPAGEWRVAYIGDLKVAPQARCGTALVRLARAAEAWARPLADAGFGVVMDGTRAVPAQYTGRAGIPPFAAVGNVMVFRFGCAALREGPPLEAREEDVRGCFHRLTAGRPACPPGDPALRSSALPVWLMHPDGSACGCLEDTRRAKRLIADDGQEMVSAHLSCFAWQNVRAGADLVRAACALAAARGFPALFVAVPRRDANALESALPDVEVVRAPATVYAHGLPNLRDEGWFINSSEI